jgi:protoheme IX farnesyltransferase
VTFSAQDLVRSQASAPRLAEALTRVRSYYALTRPGVLSLVLLTGPPALALGSEGWPDAGTLLAVLVGTALIGAGCSALNAWYERDLDARMDRTRDRPLPAGHLTPNQALRFGVLISALGLFMLYRIGGWLPATLGAATLLHYIAVYTVWLKRRSTHHTVVGAAAGASAPLIADAAIDGRLGPWGLVLFAIVFLWQPPHVWAIALFREREYAAACVPMLPATIGAARTRWRMLAFALFLVPVTLLPWLGGVLGPAYAVTAMAAGTFFIVRILQAIRDDSASRDRRVFTASLLYLTVLFAVMLGELVLR